MKTPLAVLASALLLSGAACAAGIGVPSDCAGVADLFTARPSLPEATQTRLDALQESGGPQDRKESCNGLRSLNNDLSAIAAKSDFCMLAPGERARTEVFRLAGDAVRDAQKTLRTKERRLRCSNALDESDWSFSP